VLVSGVIGCGMCAPCLAGQPNVCRAGLGRLRHHRRPPRRPGRGHGGALRRHLRAAHSRRDADEEAVLLTDILPTGYVGAVRADIRPGSTVVVVGLGPVGIMALQCAKLFGPARILAVDMVPERLARAERSGPSPSTPASHPGRLQVMEATGGRGAESVIEAVGADATVLDALSCAAPAARSRWSGSTSPWPCPSPWDWSSSRA
jgi:threonine dehydrogenase-like Zn-dependent dehydrogenase